jgi:hypothetical protein
MPKRTLFTTITPLPPKITRELAVAMLHNHDEMIELNPLVIEHHPIKTPRDAPADEFLDCVWQEMTDKIHFLPGGIIKGKVVYKACFHDLPQGLQTHVYAPLGVDIREKWSIGGSLPGEPREPREIGIDLPREGLYLREDGDLRCSRLTSGFVKKNLDNAHKVLVERILKKASRIEEHLDALASPSNRDSLLPAAPAVQPGSHLSNSAFMQSPSQATFPRAPGSPQLLSPQQDASETLRSEHPAFRADNRYSSATLSPLPPYQAQNQRQSYYDDLAKHRPQAEPKTFVAELPGSTYHTTTYTTRLTPSTSSSNSTETGVKRMSTATELSATEPTPRGPNSPDPASDRSSIISDMPPGGYRYNPQDFVQTGQGAQYDQRQYAAELPTPPTQSTQFGQQQQQYQNR